MFDDRQAAQQICILAPACRSSGSDRSSASNSGPGSFRPQMSGHLPRAVRGHVEKVSINLGHDPPAHP